MRARRRTGHHRFKLLKISQCSDEHYVLNGLADHCHLEYLACRSPLKIRDTVLIVNKYKFDPSLVMLGWMNVPGYSCQRPQWW
jgi:hypothetical protein